MTTTTTTSPSKKRKTLHDYFAHTQPAPASIQKPSPTVPPQISSDASVPGLSVIPNFVSSTEEASLLTFLSTQPWRTDLSRRTIHYGGTYCLMPPRTATPAERRKIENTILTAEPMPLEFKWLVDRMKDHGLYKDGARPEFCIVNEYISNHGISAHVENFRFDEPVCALTLGDGDLMRFHELSAAHDGSVRSGRAATAPRTGTRVDVWLPGRSLMVMKGDARWRWQHEIARSRKGRKGEAWRRVSLTFRVEKDVKKRDREGMVV